MRDVIAHEYGKEAVAEEPRVYKTKSSNAQEAHEAIRPTSAAILPSRVEGKIDPDQYKLYALIWKRAVASQMAHALFDTVAVDMVPSRQAPEKQSGPVGRPHVLRANGSTLIKPGYMAVYQEDVDDGKPENESDRILPAMKDGDVVTLAERPRRPALHRAAAALLGSLAGQGAGGTRHRPPVDLRHHHLDAQGSRVRRHGQPPLHPHRHRQDRRQLPVQAFSQVGRIRLHRLARRRARRRVARRGRLDRAAEEILEAVHLAGRAHREERLARGSRAGARARQGSGEWQADDRAHGPLRPVRADRHQGRRGKAEIRRAASGPEDGPHQAAGGAGAVQTTAQARARRPTASRSRPTSAASGRTSSTARTMCRSSRQTIPTRWSWSARSK